MGGSQAQHGTADIGRRRAGLNEQHAPCSRLARGVRHAGPKRASATLEHALALDDYRSTPDGHGLLSEPISPELVLVDPELARIAREALPEAPPQVERLKPVPRPVAPPPVVHEPSPLAAPPPLPLPLPSTLPPYEAPPPARRVPEWLRLLLAAALGGLVVAAAPPVAHRVGDALTPPGPVVAERPARTAPTTTALPTPTASKPKPDHARTVAQPHAHTRTDSADSAGSAGSAVRAKQRAERLVLRGLARAKKGSVPAGLLDPATGLVKTNVQVICTPAGTSVSVFDCLARAGDAPPGAGLVVSCRLLPGDRAELSWRGYRRS